MHLNDFDIARYVDGAVDPQERQRFEAHLQTCELCRASVADVVRLQDAVSRAPDVSVPDEALKEAVALAEEDEASRTRGGAVPPVWRYAVAAVIVVGLGIGAWYLLSSPEPDRFRAPVTADEVGLLEPSDGAQVQSLPSLRWTTQEDAMAYRVSIYTPEGTLVWQADTTAARVAPPRTLSCSAGDTYVWRVEALLADGTARGSPLHAFTCAP
ncbi:MAG: hypothetical protein GVY18_06730 [Bacteroidetes bacterium]|jgi:predicted anti-sigma-YlaC factor YlaD|nr:hypothetical protein [Bacteroidota bacterium]